MAERSVIDLDLARTHFADVQAYLNDNVGSGTYIARAMHDAHALIAELGAERQQRDNWTARAIDLERDLDSAHAEINRLDTELRAAREVVRALHAPGSRLLSMGAKRALDAYDKVTGEVR